MSELILWTSREMNRLRRDVDRLLERLWVCFAGGAELPGEMKGPYLEVIDQGERLVVIAEMPGACAEDVQIFIKGDMLYIDCEKRSVTEEAGPFHNRVKRSFRAVSKRVRLPSKIDAENVTADYADGVFRIVLPKLRVAKKKAVRIEVK
ncbi:MAG: Hsp20/alpha crystallin family protein [Deltaproteobacteria bacterium]|nr:Hsp20/alpha crystallin family protein [Deltaproteobacteria bacterium]MBW2082136.1 Hsp20/alpha crystallin family protein [Deltaproteobacteria bacterium]HDM10052.1 Hsp20/alpha crystallin family protein [Desulfobacteraceae bacterium]